MDSISKAGNTVTWNSIVVGDFNLPNINWHVDFPKVKERAPWKKLHQNFLDFVSLENLCQVVNEPTHIMGNTLDLILVSNKELVSEKSITTPSISDHFPIEFKYMFDSNMNSAIIPKERLVYTQIDNVRFTNKLKTICDRLNDMINESSTIDLVWEFFVKQIHDLINTEIPKKAIVPKRGSIWCTHAFKRKVRAL